MIKLNKKQKYIICYDVFIIIFDIIGLLLLYTFDLPNYYYLWKYKTIIKVETIPFFSFIFIIGLIWNLALSFIYYKII